jgi:hypothetical protein
METEQAAKNLANIGWKNAEVNTNVTVICSYDQKVANKFSYQSKPCL